MNRKRFGIQLDDNSSDLKIVNGHISLGETLPQNEYIILMSPKGDYKFEPTMGVGISDMLNDNDVLGWKRRIRDGLKADGIIVDQLSISQDGHIETLAVRY